MKYAILVIWKDGGTEYLKEGFKPALFGSQKQAEAFRDFMLEGMADEVQSINVIPYTADKRPGIAPFGPTWHDFQGRPDRDCELCGKPDRHPNHNPEGKFNG